MRTLAAALTLAVLTTVLGALVLLARLVLRERLAPVQVAGLAGAAVAVALLALP